MSERKRLSLEVYDIEALKAKYPAAVKQVVIVREDHSELYKYAKAHVVTGEPIPGVVITKPDGTQLGVKEAVAAENKAAGISGGVEGGIADVGVKPEDYLAA